MPDQGEGLEVGWERVERAPRTRHGEVSTSSNITYVLLIFLQEEERNEERDEERNEERRERNVNKDE